MTFFQQILLALALAGASLGAEPVTPERTSGSTRQLTIRIYDYAHIHPKLQEKASTQATKILANAGIRVRWEQCRTSDAETNRDASCTQRVGPGLIQLRIHPRDMAKKNTRRAIEFGYSLPLAEGKFGTVAGVYLDRTQAMTRGLGMDLHVVLGHTIAHEIGHLLLGTGSHAARGIMRPTWKDREIRLAPSGILGFTDEQAQRMQEQVAARLAGESGI